MLLKFTSASLVSYLLLFSGGCGKLIDAKGKTEVKAGQKTGSDKTADNSKQDLDPPPGTNDNNAGNQQPGTGVPPDAGEVNDDSGTTPPGGEVTTNQPTGSPRTDGSTLVQDGGSVTGLLADGTPYFAPGDSVYYHGSLWSEAGETTLNGAIYFKDPATADDLMSHLHAGDCSVATSPHYQHIEGDGTPGTSEIHVALTGDGVMKEGSSKVSFVPRDEPLSYVIHHDGKRYCMNLTEPAQPPTGQTTGSVPGAVVEGGSVSGLLADGTPYFAPGDSIFYKVNFAAQAGKTTFNAAIYFKSSAPEADLMSHLHAGTCADSMSPHYQHIADDPTPVSSEAHITLSGSGLSKSGTSSVDFVPRSEPLSWVIHMTDRRLCVDLVVNP